MRSRLPARRQQMRSMRIVYLQQEPGPGEWYVHPEGLCERQAEVWREAATSIGTAEYCEARVSVHCKYN